ncbi:hypothetical protein DFH09DRAFT_305201 [Mycena vulgaris]|nr:hypothetical protein DFH09DRAFT_305201 [Mycena vulgaris]
MCFVALLFFCTFETLVLAHPSKLLPRRVWAYYIILLTRSSHTFQGIQVAPPLWSTSSWSAFASAFSRTLLELLVTHCALISRSFVSSGMPRPVHCSADFIRMDNVQFLTILRSSDHRPFKTEACGEIT